MGLGSPSLLLPLLVFGVAACTSASSNFHGEIARVDAARIHVCHGFDCRNTTRLDMGAADRATLTRIMEAGSPGPAQERAAIARAVQHFEERSTEVIGVRDEARSNIAQTGQVGQMDCIDVSTNTRSLLLYLAEIGLLRHHVVETNVTRGAIVDGRYFHATAVIRETGTGERWSVDGWYGPGGAAPQIKPMSQWLGEGFLGGS
ncbi:hypothetical protein [Chelativorans sp. ZYF759]|uniref:hypothetical protein n=1 Tax=Chelativorans sp. ZYF759 TaxID=2692213 RepID=UPI00145EEC1B|nr:hypothetical protein [Chelativorans sp. ZYF759]